MKKIFALIIGISTILSAQGISQSITNIYSKTVDGKIVIDYEVEGLDASHSAFVKIFYTRDQKKFIPLLEDVEGDINKAIKTNGKKSAVWNPTARQEKFDEKIGFKIELDVNKTQKIYAITSNLISVSWIANYLVLKLELSSSKNTSLLLNIENDHFIVDNYGNKFPVKKFSHNDKYIGELYNSFILNKNSKQIITLHVKVGKSRIRFVSSVNVFDKFGNLITRVAPFAVP